MNEREYLIEQCLMDAEKGYLVDESMMSWIKGVRGGANKLVKNAGISFKNGKKNLRAGYKNTLGKLAGGDTHAAAKKEASSIKATRDSYEDVGDYTRRVERASRFKEDKAKREKQKAKDAQKLQKLAQKAYDAVNAYVKAGGKITHGKVSSVKTTLNSLRQAAGIKDEPAQEATPAAETQTQKPETQKPEIQTQKPEIQTQKSEIQTQKSETQTQAPKTTSQTPARNPMRKAKAPAERPVLKRAKAPAKRPVLKAPGKKKPQADVDLKPVYGVDPYSAEWEEVANRSVTNVHESCKHSNSSAQLKMLNSIR